MVKKNASAYPPGFKKEAPNKGFAVKKADGVAEDFRQVDPYEQYNQAEEADEIFNLLQTEAGRQA